MFRKSIAPNRVYVKWISAESRMNATPTFFTYFLIENSRHVSTIPNEKWEIRDFRLLIANYFAVTPH